MINIIMQWLPFVIGAIGFIIAWDQMVQREKSEDKIEELEDSIKYKDMEISSLERKVEERDQVIQKSNHKSRKK